MTKRTPHDDVSRPPRGSAADDGLPAPPEGWTPSPNRSTSRFAFEISRTTQWYFNDGKGNGYFAPGWDGERIARRAGLLVWIGAAAAAIILGVGAFHLLEEFSEQRNYTQLKSEGVLVPATVGTVTVEHSTHRTRNSTGRDYITDTTAGIKYTVAGRTIQAQIDHSRSTKNEYPAPAWRRGEVVKVYADPGNPERFILFHEYRDEDAGSTPRTAFLILALTGGLLIVPVVLMVVGARNVRAARRL
ncbi:DUF3592 domain-containing protein [Pseudarthrobacter sp. 1C304]|uniref:DUF3592 domain-containing protein n=1 Tax=Pseudarthrobacter sp. 1C304 TaxID=3457438 RepID=UPI003FD36834